MFHISTYLYIYAFTYACFWATHQPVEHANSHFVSAKCVMPTGKWLHAGYVEKRKQVKRTI